MRGKDERRVRRSPPAVPRRLEAICISGFITPSRAGIVPQTEHATSKPLGKNPALRRTQSVDASSAGHAGSDSHPKNKRDDVYRQ